MTEIPAWLTEEVNYEPPKGRGAFAEKTMRGLGTVLSHLKVQRGHEKGHVMPAWCKLVGLVVLLVGISVTQWRLAVLVPTVVLQLYLCTWPAEDIWTIYKPCLVAGLFAGILFLPAMILSPSGISNDLFVIWKVFLGVELVGVFNHTTAWYHITRAMRQLKLPGIFVFTLDLTMKYILLLGNLIVDLLTSYRLRAVGHNAKQYQSIGGVMGVTFLRSAEMSQEMYEAMRCRGFTDDYKGL